jgi:hypothetical protein
MDSLDAHGLRRYYVSESRLGISTKGVTRMFNQCRCERPLINDGALAFRSGCRFSLTVTSLVIRLKGRYKLLVGTESDGGE